MAPGFHRGGSLDALLVDECVLQLTELWRIHQQDTVEAFDYGAPPKRPGTPSGPRWGGGYRRPGTWIEYAKQFADTVNGHYVNQTLHPGFDPLQRQHSMLSAAMYDQMVVLEKGHHAPAKEVRAGTFIMPIGAQLKNGKVIPELLEQYRKELAASLQ